MLSYTADERWSKSAASTTQIYQDKHPFFSYFRFLFVFSLLLFVSRIYFFCFVLFWVIPPPHCIQATRLYIHTMSWFFHALRPNNKNPIHEPKAFSARPNFCSRKSKSHDIVVISEKKQEHQGAAVGIRQRWNVYNSDIILYHLKTISGWWLHTHTQKERE